MLFHVRNEWFSKEGWRETEWDNWDIRNELLEQRRRIEKVKLRSVMDITDKITIMGRIRVDKE